MFGGIAIVIGKIVIWFVCHPFLLINMILWMLFFGMKGNGEVVTWTISGTACTFDQFMVPAIILFPESLIAFLGCRMSEDRQVGQVYYFLSAIISFGFVSSIITWLFMSVFVIVFTVVFAIIFIACLLMSAEDSILIIFKF